MDEETSKEPKEKTAAELKKENDEIEAELARKEKLRVQARMAGKAVIATPPVTPKPETNKEYRKRIEQELREGKYNDD